MEEAREEEIERQRRRESVKKKGEREGGSPCPYGSRIEGTTLLVGFSPLSPGSGIVSKMKGSRSHGGRTQDTIARNT